MKRFLSVFADGTRLSRILRCVFWFGIIPIYVLAASLGMSGYIDDIVHSVRTGVPSRW